MLFTYYVLVALVVLIAIVALGALVDYFIHGY